MRLTLQQKILSAFISCAVILLVVAVFAISSSKQFADTTALVTRTHDALAEFDEILSLTLDEETGERGFVITGDAAYLEPYNQAKSSIRQHLDKVRRLTSDNPIQQRNIEELQKLIVSSEKHLDAVNELRKKDFAKSIALVATGRGKQSQDRIRLLISRCKNEGNRLLDARKKANERDSNRFQVVFIALLIVIALVLVSIFLVIRANLRALNKAERESADRNWILTGNFDLNEKIRGERTETELAQAIINQLCSYLDAQIGIIYLFENGFLSPAGSYAFDFREQNIRLIKPGEGLAGQAAAEKRTMIVDDLPDDYIRINSGLGNTNPKNLALLPLLQDGTLKGLIEIGSLKALSPLKMEFLNNIGESLAIVIQAAQSRRKLQELLEETQRQGEELEAQQEELKQSNEELHRKTDLLEQSESSLKNQQEELQQTNDELEQKASLLAEQNERLENARLDIETKAKELTLTSKYKSEFLANMSHELRTPLNSILILSQMLSENKSSSLTEKDRDFARNIFNSGTDLLNLINDILDLSKVEAGKLEMDITVVQLKEVMSDMNDLFSVVAKNKSVHFSATFSEKELSGAMETDKQRLEQILKNFLSNAFKFTEKHGKVQLSVAKVSGTLPFRNQSLLEANEVISFTVTDTGIGIPPDKFSAIFEAFQQADGSTRRKYGGTGLGLSISKELAAALGGEIHVQSEPGKGSTFTLYLPLQVVPVVAVAEEPDRAAEFGIEPMPQNSPATSEGEEDAIDDRYQLQGHAKTVLIIEDDPNFAGSLLAFVREWNYQGIVAYDGNTGLSCARFYRPHIILLDMQLPVTDGADVLRHLKADPELRHIPVLIISGYDRRKEGFDLGAFDFIKKPASGTGLKAAFQKAEDFISKKLNRLLIVEDDEMQNNAIRQLIGNGDVQCISAYSGNEAYQLLQEKRFDCVIVDLGLPDITGLELLQKIKGQPELKKIPVIVYTGKDLTREESSRLDKLASTVVLKTADSHERLLDETALLLHRVESRLPKEKQQIIRKLHQTDQVLKQRTVLIVDDDIRNIYSLTNVLEAEGLNCAVAENGREALQVLEDKGKIDIVLMDVMMPEMDGYDATKAIRAVEKFRKLPIIALTAKAMKGDREKCLSAGMSDYITKPVNIEQLLSLMRVWLYK